MARVSFADPIDLRRVRLRPLTEDDVAALVAYRSVPDVCRWVPFAPMDADVVRTRLASQWSRLELTGAGDVVVVGIEALASGALVGDVMLRWSSEVHRSAEVGYVLSPAHGATATPPRRSTGCCTWPSTTSGCTG